MCKQLALTVRARVTDGFVMCRRGSVSKDEAPVAGSFK